MQDSFKPYFQWLGIQDGRRPGNHYELLGIDLYQSDPGVIAHAADVLTARIRSIRPGQHVVQWQRLLDDVGQAKRCLLDPDAKAAYDAALRSGTELGEAAAPPGTRPDPSASTGIDPQASPSPYPSEVSPQVSPDPQASMGTPTPRQSAPTQEALPSSTHDGWADELAAIRARPRRKAARRSPVANLVVGFVTVVLVVVAGVLAVKLRQRRQAVATNEPSASQPDSQVRVPPSEHSTQPPATPTPGAGKIGPKAAKQQGPSRLKKPDPREEPKPETEPKPEEGPKPKAEPKPESEPEPGVESEPEDPPAPPGPAPSAKEPEPTSPAEEARQEALERAIAHVRLSMSKHDLRTARRHLDAAASKAETPEEQAAVARLEALAGHLEEFWSRMSRVVAELQAAEMLPIGETYIAVVESSPDELTIKAAGQLRTYQTNRMPSPLVQSLIKTKFASDTATNVLVGAYLAVDPDGDPKRARQRWEEAAQGGADVEDLMPELDYWTKAHAGSKQDPKKPTGRPAGRSSTARRKP